MKTRMATESCCRMRPGRHNDWIVGNRFCVLSLDRSAGSLFLKLIDRFEG